MSAYVAYFYRNVWLRKYEELISGKKISGTNTCTGIYYATDTCTGIYYVTDTCTGIYYLTNTCTGI